MIKLINSNKGQTLIEVIAAIAVGTIIITALLSLAARSNRNANFARTSAQATKLAQQGLEIFRNIDSVQDQEAVRRASSLCGSGDTECSWSRLYGDSTTPVDIPDPAGSSSYNFVLVRMDSGLCPITTSWCLDFGSGTPPNAEQINLDPSNFTREVLIQDGAAIIGTTKANPCNTAPLGREDSKLVTVTVRWDDPSGVQDVSVSTCISNL